MKFWYESNAVWGNVESFEDLKEKCDHQTNNPGQGCGIFDTIDEFLDRSYQNSDNTSLDFGTRGEHHGKKTLREYLDEIGELEEFLNFMDIQRQRKMKLEKLNKI